jgi:hypothetical protein
MTYIVQRSAFLALTANELIKTKDEKWPYGFDTIFWVSEEAGNLIQLCVPDLHGRRGGYYVG